MVVVATFSSNICSVGVFFATVGMFSNLRMRKAEKDFLGLSQLPWPFLYIVGVVVNSLQLLSCLLINNEEITLYVIWQSEMNYDWKTQNLAQPRTL